MYKRTIILYIFFHGVNSAWANFCEVQLLLHVYGDVIGFINMLDCVIVVLERF